MDENFTRGYCQLRQDTPRTERCPGSLTGDTLGIPRDRWSLIYLALVLCGVGFLLPYNSFITAVDFYQARFPMTTIIFDMSLTYICVAFGGVLLNNLVVEAVPLPARVTAGYVLSLGTMMFIVLCDVQLRLFSDEMSYRITLAAVGVIALGCTVQQSSFYGYTSMLPRRYTQAVMTGESAAGLIVSINRIMTKLLLHDARENTIIFFCVSIATVVMCAVVFHITRRTQFVRYYISLCEEAGITEDQRGISHHVTNPEEVSLVDILDGNVTRDNYGVLVIQSPSTPPEHEHDEIHGFSNPNYNAAYGAGNNTATQEYVEPVSPTTALPLPLPTDVQIKSQRHFYRRRSAWGVIKRGISNRWEVAKTVWPYMISICLAYFVTLCLFPGIESEVPSCRLLSWMPVILIGIFNLFDFIGKIIASIPYDWPRGRLVACTFCRTLIVPLLMLCATPRRGPYLSGEAWSMALSAVLGITNGYFGSVPMILAPSKVPDEQKELTGNIMTLSYSLGLTGGSAIAYLLDSWLGPMVDPCSPLNATAFVSPNQTVDHLFTHELTTLINTTLSTTTLLPSTTTTLSSTTTLTSTLSTTVSSTAVATTLESLTSAITTVTTFVASTVIGNITETTAESLL